MRCTNLSSWLSDSCKYWSWTLAFAYQTQVYNRTQTFEMYKLPQAPHQKRHVHFLIWGKHLCVDCAEENTSSVHKYLIQTSEARVCVKKEAADKLQVWMNPKMVMGEKSSSEALCCLLEGEQGQSSACDIRTFTCDWLTLLDNTRGSHKVIAPNCS